MGGQKVSLLSARLWSALLAGADDIPSSLERMNTVVFTK